jgi:hypothetical protein
MRSEPLHATIIGAGGIASYAVPLLARMFNLHGCLYDQDVLETRNLERQDFKRGSVGKNKAEALVTENRLKNLKPVAEWYSRSNYLNAENTEVVFCFADNRTAQVLALDVADELGIIAIIGANEYVDNEAWLYHPDHKDTVYDPRIMYPELLSKEPDEDDPVRCSAPESLEAYPQLAMANLGAAVKVAHLAHFYFNVSGGSISPFMPTAMITNLTSQETLKTTS